ncbi:MAG: hypothetical protein J6Z29_04885, partial [Ruminococcus sp.]|nr:hypothetical protein [Ruminococcus sp.]
MKRTKQRILCLFLSVCMIFTCMVGMSLTASADTTISRTDVESLLADFIKLKAEYANDSEATLALTNAYNSLSD